MRPMPSIASATTTAVTIQKNCVRRTSTILAQIVAQRLAEELGEGSWETCDSLGGCLRRKLRRPTAPCRYHFRMTDARTLYREGFQHFADNRLDEAIALYLQAVENGHKRRGFHPNPDLLASLKKVLNAYGVYTSDELETYRDVWRESWREPPTNGVDQAFEQLKDALEEADT